MHGWGGCKIFAKIVFGVSGNIQNDKKYKNEFGNQTGMRSASFDR